MSDLDGVYGVADGRDVFKVELTDTGYKFTLIDQLDHPTKGTEEDTIGLQFEVRVTDATGDQAFATFTVTVSDDMPTVEVSPNVLVYQDEGSYQLGTVSTSEYALGQTVTSETPAITWSSFVGADDEGSSTDVSLVVELPESGLITTDGNYAILLVSDPEDNNVVNGVYDGGKIAFTISIDEDGYLSVTQNVAFEHDNTQGEDEVSSRPYRQGVCTSIRDGWRRRYGYGFG